MNMTDGAQSSLLQEIRDEMCLNNHMSSSWIYRSVTEVFASLMSAVFNELILVSCVGGYRGDGWVRKRIQLWIINQSYYMFLQESTALSAVLI